MSLIRRWMLDLNSATGCTKRRNHKSKALKMCNKEQLIPIIQLKQLTHGLRTIRNLELFNCQVLWHPPVTLKRWYPCENKRLKTRQQVVTIELTIRSHFKALYKRSATTRSRVWQTACHDVYLTGFITGRKPCILFEISFLFRELSDVCTLTWKIHFRK